MGVRGELYSKRLSAGKRVYFFNVKENRNGDLFLNLVESKKISENDFDRRSIIVFEEDLKGFHSELQGAVDFINRKNGGKYDDE